MRRRILALGVGMTALVVAAFAIPLALLIRSNVESRELDGARFEAENVAYFISTQDPDGDLVAGYLDRSAGRYDGSTWVVFPDGSVVGDVPAGLEGSPDADRTLSGETRGSADIGKVSAAAVTRVNDGALTGVQATTQDGPSTVYTFLTEDELHEGLAPPLLILVAVSLVLLLVSFGAAEALSRRLARPLEKTAEAARRLAAGEGAARAPESGPPEVADVGAALNGLATRIDEVIAVEREAVADLSHRLRTPLTALRLDIDALDDPETSARLGDHVTVLERSLTSIIHAARRPQREGLLPHADAVAVVRERASFWTPLAEDQGRPVTVSLPDRSEPVRSSGEDLAAAVDALIENVIAHTPEGSGLDVSVSGGERNGPVLVSVGDRGPGIPLDAGRRGRSDRGSTGLGLDIARRCAEASGGTLAISDREPTGALVELTLGRA